MERLRGARRSTPPGGTTSYTGGGPGEPLTELADKVVGLIGTGATGIQCVPPLGRGGRARLRVPAHAVGDRRAGQPAHRPRLRRRAGARAGSRRGWTTSRPSCWASPVDDDLVDDGWTHHYAAVAQPAPAQGHDARGVPPRRRGVRLRGDGGAPAPGRGDRRRPRHRRGAQAVLPLPVQAALLPRRVPRRVQPAQRHPRRLPGRHRPGHRAGPGGRRARVRGRLHRLRHRLRGRAHAAVPPRRPRHHRPGRRHPGREVGGRRRQPLRDDDAAASRTCSSCRRPASRPWSRSTTPSSPCSGAEFVAGAVDVLDAAGRDGVRRERRGRGGVDARRSSTRSSTPAPSWRPARRRGSTTRAIPRR